MVARSVMLGGLARHGAFRPLLLGAVVAVLGGCRKTALSLDLGGPGVEQEVTVYLPRGGSYAFWEEIDYELDGSHEEEACFVYRIQALQAGAVVASADCVAFRLGGPCPGGTSRSGSGESGDCKVSNCELTLPAGGKTTVRAGVHRVTPCGAANQNRFQLRPRFKRLKLKMGT